MPTIEQGHNEKNLRTLIKEAASLCQMFRVSDTPAQFSQSLEIIKDCVNNAGLTYDQIKNIEDSFNAMRSKTGKIHHMKVTPEAVQKLLTSLKPVQKIMEKSRQYIRGRKDDDFFLKTTTAFNDTNLQVHFRKEHKKDPLAFINKYRPLMKALEDESEYTIDFSPAFDEKNVTDEKIITEYMGKIAFNLAVLSKKNRKMSLGDYKALQNKILEIEALQPEPI